MNRQEALKRGQGASLCPLDRGIAYALALVLIATSLSSTAKAEWQPKPLPGTTTSNGAVVAGAAIAAVGGGLLVYYLVRHKKHHASKLHTQPLRFGDLAPGQSAHGTSWEAPSVRGHPEITTAVPNGAATGKVEVTTPSGTLTSNIKFPGTADDRTENQIGGSQ